MTAKNVRQLLKQWQHTYVAVGITRLKNPGDEISEEVDCNLMPPECTDDQKVTVSQGRGAIQLTVSQTKMSYLSIHCSQQSTIGDVFQPSNRIFLNENFTSLGQTPI